MGGFSIGRFDTRGTDIFILLALNYITSKNERDYFELAAGIIPVILREVFLEEGMTFSRMSGNLDLA